MLSSRQRVRRPEFQAASEEGLILLAVLFLVVLVLIAMAVAAPKIARSIQRDKEIELMHRGEQYKRAIKLYYKKYGAYPTSIDQLVNTDNIRYLRKRYTDPITGKDDWKLIYLGQAKVPPLGFFGQPLTGLPGAATVVTPMGGVAGGGSMPGTSAFGAPSSAFGQSGVSSFGSTPLNGSTAGSTLGSSSGTPGSDSSGSSDSGTVSGSTSAGTPGDSSGSSTSTPTSGTVTTAGFGFTTQNDASGTGTAGGSTIGGGPIVGVGIPSTKASLLEYKKQKHYNEWEFVYNPIEEQIQAAGVIGAGTQNVNGTGGGFNTGTGSFGNINGSGPGTSTNSGAGFGTDSGSSGTGFGSSDTNSSGTTTPTSGTPSSTSQPQQPQ